MLQISALGILSAWLFGGSTHFAQAFLVGLSWLALIFYFLHISEIEQSTSESHRTLFFYLTPFLIGLGCYAIGIWNQPVSEIEFEGKAYLALTQTSQWLPTTLLPSQSWLPLLLGGGLYLTALTMLLVIKAEDVARRILVTLCISAAILSLLGCLQAVLRTELFLGMISIPVDSLFSIFPHPHGWASFALLWSAAMLGMCSHYIRHIHINRFLDQGGVWFIVGTSVLMLSVVISGTALHILLLTLLLGIASFDISKNIKSAKRLHKRLFMLGGILVISAGITGFLMTASHAMRTAFYLGYTPIAGISWAEQGRLMRDTWELFLQKPLFGWGDGSFRTMMAFMQESDYGNLSYSNAHCDLLQGLMQKGLVGMLAWAVIPVIITIKFLRLPSRRPLSWYLFSGAVMGLILGLFGFPFQFPAFTFSFWLLLFAAYQWSVIPHLDALNRQRPELVFSETLRRTRLKEHHPKEQETLLRKDEASKSSE